WILKLPNRQEDYSRNQLVLDLANPKVQDFVFGVIEKLMTAYPKIAYMKWDCNRMMTNAYSPYLKENQSQLYIDYVRGLYKVFEKVKTKYPALDMMLCSGGGGRVDYQAMKYFTEYWPSDMTDAYERVFIQWGYTFFYPANASCNHVTSAGKQSLKFRTDVAMMGKMGYDIPVGKMTDKELQFSRDAVKLYKQLSETIWFGDLYRLVSPYEEERAVLMYVSKDKSKATLFSYVLNMRYEHPVNRVRLQGLEPTKKYRVKEVNLFPGTTSAFAENGKLLSGEFLMKAGMSVSSHEPLSSAVFEITSE
ncbi:MAG: alpha-galactosidase, partial [Candidatus Nephrothrix sp. EaCA]